jgi:hypothetical protein
VHFTLFSLPYQLPPTHPTNFHVFAHTHIFACPRIKNKKNMYSNVDL